MSSHAKVAQLIIAHHGFVKGLAVRIAPWPGLADDIAQQVFLEFLAKESKWDLETDVKPLLATMTRHVAMRCWRERTRQMPETVWKLAEHIRDLASADVPDPRWDDEVVALKRCLEKLPDKSRSLVDLHYFGGATTVEIADSMTVKADAVRQALCRLRGQLRTCIETALAKGSHA